MPQYLYRLGVTRPAMLTEGPTEDEARLVSAHFERLKQATADGVVILAGRTLTTGPDGMGIVIFNAADDEAARVFMETDPAVVGGVMHATLFPYRVALISEANALREA